MRRRPSRLDHLENAIKALTAAVYMLIGMIPLVFMIWLLL